MGEAIIERRRVPLGDVEVRQDGDDIHFTGKAAVFNKLADLGLFREKIATPAFNKTIREADVALLYNHDDSSIMARTSSGTLRLSVNQIALIPDADLDRTDPDVQRVLPKMRRGDLHQMSFAFEALRQEWDDHPADGGTPIRTLLEVRLYDVSVVTFPAYEQTDASIARSVEKVHERRMRQIEVETETPPEEARLDESAWDGNTAMGQCSTAADYRSICAGETSDGDPDQRQHWKLPHHYLGKEANAGGVRNARSRFEQTQGLINKDAARTHLFTTHKLPSDEGRSLDELLKEAEAVRPDDSTEEREEPQETEGQPSRIDHSLAERRALRDARIRYLEETIT